MSTVPLRPVGEHDALGHRVRRVARYYNEGTQLGPVEAIDLMLERLTEAERRLAKVAFALRDDEGRTA